MLKRPHIIALGLVLLLALVVLNLPHNAANQLKLAIGSLFLPLFGVSRASHQLAEKAGDTVVSRAELLRQIEDLRRTNQVLEQYARQADGVLRENDRLRQLVNWKRETPWKDRLKLARVIASDPTIWWHTVRIDVGTNAGVRADMPVLDASGFLVGRVSSAGPASSEVVLLGDPNCPISARVGNSGESGIIVGGASPVNYRLVTLSYLPVTGSLKPGQGVFTSGMGTLPRGIPIGQIAENPRTAEQGYAEVQVKLGANPGTLDEVWVLIP